jgi:hypothetical protein
MNVGTEAVQFPEKEYIIRIFLAVRKENILTGDFTIDEEL